MENILHLRDMGKYLAQQRIRKRIAVLNACDESTQHAVAQAMEEGWLEAVFVGGISEVQQCERLVNLSQYASFVDAATHQEAVEKALDLVHQGVIDGLMKGLISSADLIRPLLSKDRGFLSDENVLTHVTVADIPAYHKLLFFTDSAVIPYPTQEQRFMQIKYVTELCRRFGIVKPLVSLIHCYEKPNEKHFPFSTGYASLIENARQGAFGPCVVDGPLDVRESCNREIMQRKGISSAIQGNADVLVFPDIEAANAFYKSITLFAGAKVSGVLMGTRLPVVLPSRGDDSESKYNSLALACLNH